MWLHYIGETKQNAHNAEVRWNKHITQLKVQKNPNTSETQSTTVLHGAVLFQMLQKMLRPGKT